MGHAIADRRWYHVFLGRRPQAFGRYRSVKPLVVDGRTPERVIVGRIGKPAALIAVQSKVQICAIAAPQSGKTSGLVTPALLEHDGPAVTTSTKTDVVLATRARRERMGETFVWDPFGERSHCWDPLQGCESWAHALLVARWLGHAMQLGQTATAEYFDEAAQELAAPLLHAAAITDDQTIVDVYRWVCDRDVKAPTQVLTAAGADDALARLESVYALNDRQRDGVLGTVQVQLKAYGHPAAARTAARGGGIRPERLFDGAANTIYLVAGREHQRLLAPLVVTMLSSLLFYASEQENRTGRPLAPQALFALDETAQIAPLQELPQILSVSLSAGIRFLTIWHSIAQMRERYGADAAATILALSQAKVFLGSITDEYTRQELVHLLGQRPEERDGHTQYRDALTAQALQRLGSGQGLLIHGELPPVFFQQRRYFEDRALQQLRAA
jgi:type IV secretory pathway TraG/TraD family ATPase VirD4